MFICEDCLKGSCEGCHLSSSFGPCEGCGETKETWECFHYKAKGTGVKSLAEVQMQMLSHLRDLARELQDASGQEAVASLVAKMECAREMCRLAGIPENVIVDTERFRARG